MWWVLGVAYFFVSFWLFVKLLPCMYCKEMERAAKVVTLIVLTGCSLFWPVMVIVSIYDEARVIRG